MKNILLPLIIVLVIAAVAGYFVLMPKTGTPTSTVTDDIKPTSAETNTTDKAETTDALASLKELVSKGIPQRCTFDYSDPDTGKNAGTMFISGNKLRGDFMIKDSEGKTTNGGMITDDAYLYTWDNDTKEGFKMALTADIKKQQDDIRNNPGSVFDMDKKANYNCSPWVVQAGIFTPPQDVKFADFSEMMKGWGEEKVDQKDGQSADVDLCSLCANLQGEELASCKETMKCE